MKDLIITALDNAFAILGKIVPQTKNETVYVNIEHVNPLELVDFMKKNNIPDDAGFGGKPNGYDAFDEICLCYDIKIPTTDNDKLKFKKHKFSSLADYDVYRLLTSSGYKKIGFTNKLFNDPTIYDMYIAKDFDKLVKYYSLYFVKS